MEKLGFLKPVTLKGKMRLGPQLDGGYVVYERILKETDALITYGVGWNAAFEEHFNELTSKAVWMFDPTMFGRYLLDLKQLKTSLLYFRIGAIVKQFQFTWHVRRVKKKLESKNIRFINEGISTLKDGKYDSFPNHIARLGLKRKRLILKLDIEGDEYKVFLDKHIYDHLNGVEQIIVEFHDLKTRLRDLQKIISNLAGNFSLVHVHANNNSPTFTLYDLDGNQANDISIPDVLELLWVRTDRLRKEDISQEPVHYPIKELDYPNNPRKQDYALQFI